jgi:hypothetical protein
MSNTLVRPDDTNLSPSRTGDGISEDAVAIPAVNPTADGRSDSVRKFAEPLPTAPPARTSRRGFLMNSIVSAAAVASATAIPNQSIATIQITAVNPPLERAQQIVETLRNYFLSTTSSSLDEEAAERMLSYFRRRNVLDDHDSEDEDGEVFHSDVVEFFERYNQSLDWVVFGDPRGLICSNVARAAAVVAEADAGLLALAEEYIAAERKYDELNYNVDQMEGGFRGKNERPVPAALYLRSSDGELGLPCPTMLYISARLGNLKDRSAAYYSEIDIAPLRDAKWLISTISKTEDSWRSDGKYSEPSPDARARANEIIAAYEDWQTTARKPPRGYKKAVRERDRAGRASQKIEKEIAKTPAKTVRGMFAKLRCAQHYAGTTLIDEIDSGGCTEVMAISIFNDVKRMSGNRIAAAEANWLPTFGAPGTAPILRRRTKATSQYDLYPMPFFNADRRCTWDIKPTGNYGVDCETGKEYAVRFLESCDGTIGWSSIVGQIAADMILAGPDHADARGRSGVNGVVIGFMGTVGSVLAACMPVVLSQRQA